MNATGDTPNPLWRIVSLVPGNVRAVCNICGQDVLGVTAIDTNATMREHAKTHLGGPTDG